MTPSELLTFISIMVTGYSIFQSTDKSDSDKIKFLEQIIPFLKVTDFIKKIHNLSQNAVEDRLRFLEKDLTVDAVSATWLGNRVSLWVEGDLKRLYSLSKYHSPDSVKEHGNKNINHMMEFIGNEINLVNDHYPELLKEFDAFYQKIKEINKLINDGSLNKNHISGIQQALIISSKSLLLHSDLLLLDLITIQNYFIRSAIMKH